MTSAAHSKSAVARRESPAYGAATPGVTVASAKSPSSSSSQRPGRGDRGCRWCAQATTSPVATVARRSAGWQCRADDAARGDQSVFTDALQQVHIDVADAGVAERCALHVHRSHPHGGDSRGNDGADGAAWISPPNGYAGLSRAAAPLSRNSTPNTMPTTTSRIRKWRKSQSVMGRSMRAACCGNSSCRSTGR